MAQSWANFTPPAGWVLDQRTLPTSALVGPAAAAMSASATNILSGTLAARRVPFRAFEQRLAFGRRRWTLAIPVAAANSIPVSLLRPRYDRVESEWATYARNIEYRYTCKPPLHPTILLSLKDFQPVDWLYIGGGIIGFCPSGAGPEIAMEFIRRRGDHLAANVVPQIEQAIIASLQR